MTLVIERAGAADIPEVLCMIRRLAEYEGQPEAVKATETSLAGVMLGPDPPVHAFIARLDGRAVGLALWFLNFSTWTSGRGLYLEDLFVERDVRGAGVGRALFRALAREAARLGCARIDWAVLDWNEQATGFYRRLGARAMRGWQPWRLDGDALAALAAEG